MKILLLRCKIDTCLPASCILLVLTPFQTLSPFTLQRIDRNKPVEGADSFMAEIYRDINTLAEKICAKLTTELNAFNLRSCCMFCRCRTLSCFSDPHPFPCSLPLPLPLRPLSHRHHRLGSGPVGIRSRSWRERRKLIMLVTQTRPNTWIARATVNLFCVVRLSYYYIIHLLNFKKWLYIFIYLSLLSLFCSSNHLFCFSSFP